MEQVIKSVNQIERVNNLQSINFTALKPAKQTRLTRSSVHSIRPSLGLIWRLSTLIMFNNFLQNLVILNILHWFCPLWGGGFFLVTQADFCHGSALGMPKIKGPCFDCKLLLESKKEKITEKDRNQKKKTPKKPKTPKKKLLMEKYLFVLPSVWN